jgi:outer membrane protein
MKRIAGVLVLVMSMFSPLIAQEQPSGTHTLEQCITLSLEQSPAVLSAEKEIKRADGIVWETWADIVSADISAEYTTAGPGGGSSISSSRDGFSVELGGSVPIFSGGRVINGILTAYRTRDVAREQYRRAVNETVYDVTITFGKILLDREMAKVRSEEIDFLTKTYDATKTRYDTGMASWFEFLRTQVELTNAEPSLMEAEDSLENDTDDLKKILGMDVGRPLNIEGELAFDEVTRNLDECLNKARADNPDIRIAYLEEEIARKNVRSVIGQYFPTISVFGRYGYSSDRLDISFDGRDWDYTGGVMVTIPITDILVISARLKQARAEYDRAGISRRDTENAIEAEVRKAYRDLARSQKLVKSQRENVALAKQGLDIAEIQYENGINTYLELMDTRLALTQANLNYVNAVYSSMEALARLSMLMGESPSVPGTPADGGPDAAVDLPR